MSTTIGIVLAVCGAATLLFWLGRKDGYARGYNAGWLSGRKKEQDWWAEQGREIDREREKIWREELSHVEQRTSDPDATL